MARPDVVDRPTRYTSVTIGSGRFLWEAPRTGCPNGHAMLAQQTIHGILVVKSASRYIQAIHIHRFTEVCMSIEIYFRLNILVYSMELIPAAGTLRAGRSAPCSDEWVACFSGPHAQMLPIGPQKMHCMAAQPPCVPVRICAICRQWHIFPA